MGNFFYAAEEDFVHVKNKSTTAVKIQFIHPYKSSLEQRSFTECLVLQAGQEDSFQSSGGWVAFLDSNGKQHAPYAHGLIPKFVVDKVTFLLERTPQGLQIIAIN